jgi:quercetin dioxygenase-like cupin family protein
MNLRGRLSETAGGPGAYEGHSGGYRRRVLFDRAGGSVHQEVVIAEFEPGGSVDRHLHAFEEAFYVFDGSLVLEAAGAVERLGADDYVFVDRGVAHALRNDSGAPVRWFEVAAPQPGATLEDTVFVTEHALPEGLERPYWRDHFALAELPAPSGAILAGFDAANVDGAALKILVGPATGASQLNLMAVQYVPGGFITTHDHAFEEGFYFLEGEIEAELAGETHTLRAGGDYCWSGVGDSHALVNRSDGIVRWLETQVPQPPPRYQARFTAEWERFLAKP